MLSICRGIVETTRALHEVDPDIVAFHVDATDVFESSDPALAEEAERRQAIVFLALDLISGRVDARHPLWTWLLGQGAAEQALNAFRERPLELSVIGVNLYPIFTLKRMSRDRFGRLRIRMPNASGALVTKIGEMYFERYGAPLMISETATKGSVRQRQVWLTDSVEAVKTLRAKGVPMVGYTWWPMFALVTWAYRQGLRPLHDHLLQMGLWNLDPDPLGRLDRVETPLVDAFRRLISGGADAVGPLAPTPRLP
jgi:hypothetical protein